MKCTQCGREVVLVPSAAERAARDVTGKTANYYTKLFPRHTRCELELRNIRSNGLTYEKYQKP